MRRWMRKSLENECKRPNFSWALTLTRQNPTKGGALTLVFYLFDSVIGFKKKKTTGNTGRTGRGIKFVPYIPLILLRLIRFSFPVNPVLPVVCWEILFLNLYSSSAHFRVRLLCFLR
jgi:hypothetical protein